MPRHNHPGDDREDEELAPLAHVRDVDEDDIVVMEIGDDLLHGGALRTEERPVAVDEVLNVPLDDPDRTGHGVSDLIRERVFPQRLVSGVFDGEDLRVHVFEEVDDLLPARTGECLNDIVLGLAEVMEDGEITDPEVVEVEVKLVHAVPLPVGFAADGEDGKPVPPVRVVDEPFGGLTSGGFAAVDVLTVGIDDEEAELLLFHAGGTEGLHEIALAHPGGSKDTHVLGEYLCGDTNGDVFYHVLATPHQANLDLPHLAGEEHEVFGGRVLDGGELGGDGAGLVKFPSGVDKPEWHGIDRDEDILAKAVELLAERAGVPFGVGKVAVMREIGDLGKEGQALGFVNDLPDVPDVERLAVRGDEAIGEHAPAGQPVFCFVHVINIVQIHHVNHQKDPQKPCSSCPVSRARI